MTRRSQRLAAMVAGCVCLLSASALAKDKAQQLRFEFAGKLRTYYLFVPDGEGGMDTADESAVKAYALQDKDSGLLALFRVCLQKPEDAIVAAQAVKERNWKAKKASKQAK